MAQFIQIRRIITLVFLGLSLQICFAKGQKIEPNKDRRSFNYYLKYAKLEFHLPPGFHSVDLATALTGRWSCAPQQFTNTFNYLIRNADSTIMVGLRVLCPLPSGGDTTKLNMADIDWKDNLDKTFKYYHDKLKNPPKYINKNVLKDVWETDYGVEYSRPCTRMYLSHYPNHRIVAIGHKDWEMEIVYFYINNLPPIDFVSLSKMLTLKK